MSKFCSNCGFEVADDANNCSNCGNPFAEVTPAPQAPETSLSFDIKKYIPIGVAAVAVVLVIVILASVFGGAYKKPLKYMEQTANGKFKNVEKLAPKAYWEYYEEEYDEDVKDTIEELEENYEDYTLDYLEEEYGENVKISIKNIKKKKTLSERKLDDLRENLKDNYDIPKKSVTKAFVLEYDIVVKGDDDDDEDESETIVAKIDGKWYAVSEDGYFSGL